MFVACILSFLTFGIALFLILLTYKAMKISEDQLKIRLNDIFQVMSCVMIPVLSAVGLIRAMISIWYFYPYENIFNQLLPLETCYGMLALFSFTILVQVIGARGGNTESHTSVNLYLIFTMIIVAILGLQWQ